MLAVATQLGAPVSELNAIQSTPDIGARQLWRRMDASAARWLLVFDDADSPGLFDVPGEDLLDEDAHGSWLRPSPAGTVLVTSRAVDSTRWGPIADLVEVPDLAAGAGALALLDRCTADAEAVPPARRAEAVAVVEHLGGVALAVDTVGTYLASDTARSDMTHLLAELRDGRHTDARRIGAAWDVVTAALDARGLPEARTLLRVLACYAPQWVIPLEVLAPERLALAELPTAVADADELRVWERALAGLLDVGLISRRHTAGQQVEGVVVHRLVAETARAEADPYDERVLAGAVRVLRQESKQLGWGRPADWPALRRLEPHVYALLDNLGPEAGAAVRSKALRVANNVAAGLIRGGLFALGEALIRHALACTGELGVETPESLAAEHTLAWALGLRGELAEAERRFRALVRASGACTEPRRGPRCATGGTSPGCSPNRAGSKTPTTAVRSAAGERTGAGATTARRCRCATTSRGSPRSPAADQAEPRPSSCCRGASPPSAPTTWRCFDPVPAGVVPRLQGRCAEAEAGFEALLADIESVFAPDSPSVVMVRSRLGCGRGRAASTRPRRTTASCWRPASGCWAAVTRARLRARHHLATLLLRRGDHRGAERLLREVIAEAERGLELAGTTRSAWRAATGSPACSPTPGVWRRRSAPAGRWSPNAAVSPAPTIPPRCGRASWWRWPSCGQAAFGRPRSGCRPWWPTRSGCWGSTTGTRWRPGRRSPRCTGGPGGSPSRSRRAWTRSRAGWPGSDRTTPTCSTAAATSCGCSARCTRSTRPSTAAVTSSTTTGADPRVMHPETLSARYRARLAVRPREPAARRPCGRSGSSALDQHRILGREHPATLRTRHGLAHEMLRAYQFEEAELALRSVLLDRVHILGPAPPRHADQPAQPGVRARPAG